METHRRQQGRHLQGVTTGAGHRVDIDCADESGDLALLARGKQVYGPQPAADMRAMGDG